MDATELAKELIDLHDHPRLVTPFSARYPGLTAETGYAAARQFHAHRLAQGWKMAGRKIGFTNRTIWQRYGVHQPMWGTVYDRTIVFSQKNHATVPLAGLVQPRIEPEICFGLRSAPRAADTASLLEAIDWIAHSVEIVQCERADWKVTLADCAPQNAFHGRLIVGARIPMRAGMAEILPRVSLVLMKNGAEVDRGVGANVLDSPLLALAHLVALLQEPFKPGEIISTGTLTDAHPIAPGETWSTRLDGLPLEGLTIGFR